jgi:hypothetical protein
MKPIGDHGASQAAVFDALRAREPIFHRGLAGRDRAAYERVTADDYWEVGASGKVYGREVVIDTLVRRSTEPGEEHWSVHDFAVRHLGGESWLATYELHQGTRPSRRSSIWTSTGDGWVAQYHQGTLL